MSRGGDPEKEKDAATGKAISVLAMKVKENRDVEEHVTQNFEGITQCQEEIVDPNSMFWQLLKQEYGANDNDSAMAAWLKDYRALDGEVKSCDLKRKASVYGKACAVLRECLRIPDNSRFGFFAGSEAVREKTYAMKGFSSTQLKHISDAMDEWRKDEAEKKGTGPPNYSDNLVGWCITIANLLEAASLDEEIWNVLLDQVSSTDKSKIGHMSVAYSMINEKVKKHEELSDEEERYMLAFQQMRDASPTVNRRVVNILSRERTSGIGACTNQVNVDRFVICMLLAHAAGRVVTKELSVISMMCFSTTGAELYKALRKADSMKFLFTGPLVLKAPAENSIHESPSNLTVSRLTGACCGLKINNSPTEVVGFASIMSYGKCLASVAMIRGLESKKSRQSVHCLARAVSTSFSPLVYMNVSNVTGDVQKSEFKSSGSKSKGVLILEGSENSVDKIGRFPVVCCGPDRLVRDTDGALAIPEEE